MNQLIFINYFNFQLKMDSKYHAPEEFLGRFGSKLDLYNLLKIDR